MNQYVTGGVIKDLREKNKLTQAELAKNSVFRIRQFPNGKPEFPKVKETTYKSTLTLLPIRKIKDLLEVLLWLRT